MISGANFIRGSIIPRPTFCQKARGGHISLRFAWIPTSRASIRIGRSPRRGRNDLERQPHDGEPVADGNVLPRNTRTTFVDGGASNSARLSVGVAPPFFFFFLPLLFWVGFYGPNWH
jgi:hypothetical protein